MAFRVVISAFVTILSDTLVGLLIFYDMLKFKHLVSFVVVAILALLPRGMRGRCYESDS